MRHRRSINAALMDVMDVTDGRPCPPTRPLFNGTGIPVDQAVRRPSFQKSTISTTRSLSSWLPAACTRRSSKTITLPGRATCRCPSTSSQAPGGQISPRCARQTPSTAPRCGRIIAPGRNTEKPASNSAGIWHTSSCVRGHSVSPGMAWSG